MRAETLVGEIARYAADKRRWQEISEKLRLARPAATSAAPMK